MVLAYGALANGGVLMEPRLVREVRSRDGRMTHAYKPRAVRRVVPENVARDLREVLVGVVETGTGRAAALGPFAVAGKTGTARSFRGGHYESGAYTASFAGFFPAEDPQLVFIVKLDTPKGVYYGGVAAAPVTRATLEAALAARNSPLDKRAMAVAAPPPFDLNTPSSASATTRRPKTAPFTFALNAATPRPTTKVQPTYALPDVLGLAVRDAVRQLHASGYRVQVAGNGIVRAVSDPTANVVRVTAERVLP
jgi:membrane peptidoglycan carboxypeptidase